MSTNKLSAIAWRELLPVLVPGLLLLVVTFAVACYFVQPSPPRALVIASGPAGGQHALLAERYARILATHGVELKVQASSGSVENLARLRDPRQSVEVAFVEGGSAFRFDGGSSADDPANRGLLSLGGLYYAPVWIFHRDHGRPERLSQLAGKRLAIGPEGSGTRRIVTELLRASGVGPDNATLLDLTGTEAARALRSGAIDVAFLFGMADAPEIDTLLRAADVQLMSLSQAAGLARRYPFLTHLSLPAGAIDLAANIPERNVDLVGVTVNLIIRDTLHHALKYLLLEAMAEVHGPHGLFHDKGTFPSTKGQDIAICEEGEQFQRSGKPFLQRQLPFWIASLVERLIVLLVPILAVLVPLIKYVPDVYAYRIEARVSRWYKALRSLEREIGVAPTREEIDRYAARLDSIEDEVNAASIPIRNSESIYSVRSAIDLIRERLGTPHGKIIPALRSA
jgi:TRAP transporter TAXI family solute receptor